MKTTAATKTTKIRVRYIEQADLEDLMEAERAFNLVNVNDPDFGQIEALNPWVLSAEDVLTIIRQNPLSDRSNRDTRTLVVEAELTATGREGNVYIVPWVCGGFAYEMAEDGFAVLFTIIHPSCDIAEVFQVMLDYLKNKARSSSKRKRITLFLRDRDEAGLRQFMPVVQAEGFQVHLRPDHFGSHDGWECVLDLNPGPASSSTSRTQPC